MAGNGRVMGGECMGSIPRPDMLQAGQEAKFHFQMLSAIIRAIFMERIRSNFSSTVVDLRLLR